MVAFLNQFRSKLAVVRVDTAGIGHNFGLHLRYQRFVVELINVGMPCESKPDLGENDPARRFVNLKAQFYQSLADDFERGRIEGLTDETTIGQLAGIVYELDSQGRIKIESKEKARARGVPSPDRAEALMLALCKPPIKFEYFSIRDLDRNRRSADYEPGHPYWGFRERPYDADDWAEDYRVKRRRWRRGWELF